FIGPPQAPQYRIYWSPEPEPTCIQLYHQGLDPFLEEHHGDGARVVADERRRRSRREGRLVETWTIVLLAFFIHYPFSTKFKTVNTFNSHVDCRSRMKSMPPSVLPSRLT